MYSEAPKLLPALLIRKMGRGPHAPIARQRWKVKEKGKLRCVKKGKS